MNATETNPTATPATDNWKVKILVVGTVIGALVGVGAAYLLAQGYEKQGRHPEISSREGIKLAVLLLGTVRGITALAEPK